MMDNQLAVWSWAFLVIYTLVMLGCGAIGMRLVKSGDDFATARGAYGPLFLAFAMTASTASGATFLGIPGVTYQYGVSGLWWAFIYPVAVYAGVALCLVIITRAGKIFGSRSIPEYLGDRYQSPFLRVAMAVFSLMLLFYLAGQIIAGTVMFNQMLGLTPLWAMLITVGVLIVYVTLGGAHADILTDGLQGALMLALSVAVTVLFLIGYGTDGGLSEVFNRLESLDARAVKTFHPDNPVAGNWWHVVCIFVAHIPLGMLPHLGNKVWALKDGMNRRRFILLSFLFGMTLPAIALGGLLSRSVLGNALLENPNHAIPALFIQLFPPWLAALLGAGILAAVMSTADGLVVSTSQVFANDIYRRTLAPWLSPRATSEQIDHRVLQISRVATVLVLVASLLLAWNLQNRNIALVVWLGTGGMMAALSGPLVLGVLSRRITKAGAIAGFFAGAGIFIVLKTGLLSDLCSGIVGRASVGDMKTTSALVEASQYVAEWLALQSANPFACATLGIIASLVITPTVSLFTPKLPDEHLASLFARADSSRGIDR